MEKIHLKPMNNIELYRMQSQKIVDRFLAHTLTFSECRSALDATLVDLMRTTPEEQLASLCDLTSHYGKIVRRERERRESSDSVSLAPNFSLGTI